MMFVDDILAFFLIPRVHTENASLKESEGKSATACNVFSREKLKQLE